jgi:protein-disulfide isomerase
VILEYGDYECPYSRQAFRAIERVKQELNGRTRFAFRHFPLVQIHPHAFGAAAVVEAAAMTEAMNTTDTTTSSPRCEDTGGAS